MFGLKSKRLAEYQRRVESAERELEELREGTARLEWQMRDGQTRINMAVEKLDAVVAEDIEAMAEARDLIRAGDAAKALAVLDRRIEDITEEGQDADESKDTGQ